MAKMRCWLGGIFCFLFAQDTCSYEVAGYADWPNSRIELWPAGRYDSVDAFGFFHMHGVCAGPYKLRLWFEGHVVAEVSISVPQEAPLYIEGRERLHTVVIEGHLSGAFHVEPLSRPFRAEQGLAMQLLRVPGVALSQGGPYIAKPIMEGLRGSRIAYWQGGQPLASQQWGEDHAPEIDPFSAEEIEAQLGSSPVRHGTEGVGGAIVLPIPLVCCLRQTQGRFLVTGVDNGRGGLIGLRLQGNLLKWGYRLQGSVLRVGTLQAPLYYLTGTGTMQAHGSFTLHRLWSRWQIRLYYAQYNALIGLFQGMHTGNLSDLQRALSASSPLVPSVFSYKITPPYQEVEHELTSVVVSRVASDGALWTVTMGRQYNRRRERDLIGLYTGGAGVALDLQLTTHFVQLTYEKNGWFAGAFFQHQRNYRQYAYFIPAYERWQGGVFGLYRFSKWELGFRVEPVKYRYSRVILQGGGMPVEGGERVFWPLAAETGWSGRSLRVRWSLLTRAPNPAELYAYGYHQAQAAFYIGANELRMEPTAALRIAHEMRRLAWGVGLYYSPAFVWERVGAPILSLRGAALTLRYAQSPAAWLSLSGRWQERLSPHLSWELRGAYLWGTIYTSSAIPMPLLPPLVLTPTLTAAYRRWEGEIYWQHQFRQTRYAIEAEYIKPPAGYGLLGAEIRYRIGGWYIACSGDNLLNHAYRAYPDLMRFFADQVGRQIRITFRYDFEL
ncbi:MAG: TonB-dependent receptor [Bacteroidia bacterium]|nr:TonB-dependent receptor [Bacteroidia bacterium]